MRDGYSLADIAAATGNNNGNGNNNVNEAKQFTFTVTEVTTQPLTMNIISCLYIHTSYGEL